MRNKLIHLFEEDLIALVLRYDFFKEVQVEGGDTHSLYLIKIQLDDGKILTGKVLEDDFCIKFDDQEYVISRFGTDSLLFSINCFVDEEGNEGNVPGSYRGPDSF